MKEVQIVTHVLKLNKVPLFAKKPVNINISGSAAPKLALVPARHYNSDVKKCIVSLESKEVHMGTYVLKLSKVQMGHMASKLTRGFVLLKNWQISMFQGLLSRN